MSNNQVAEIAEIKNKIDKAVFEWLETIKHRNELFDAVSYALNGGKRLRPMLLIISNMIAGGSFEEAKPYAVAIELIHNYSLIHDDMPCMDNDDFRRGQPTVHKKYGEWIALLAGDSLLNGAFEILFNNKNDYNALQMKAAYTIADSAGINGMVYGQYLDLKGNINTIEQLNTVNQYKTGKLFEAAMVSGALIANADEALIQKLKVFAYHFGLAFQIADDIDDYENPAVDKSGLFSNFAVIAGIEKAREEKINNINKAKTAVFGLNHSELLNYILQKI